MLHFLDWRWLIRRKPDNPWLGVATMKLLEQVRHVARVKHLALRTQRAYAYWIERYIRFHNNRHPQEMARRKCKRLEQNKIRSRIKIRIRNS